ncbi:MAG TPA: hypothetical protein VGN43_18710 [Steroidobacteraceae bacterium]|nr:hypothetical protein [Steroidobacteraceae bacterium]
MHITVESVKRKDRSGPFVAKVRATSCGRIGGMPRAVIELTLQLDEAQTTASQTQLREIARDEALRFLDVA